MVGVPPHIAQSVSRFLAQVEQRKKIKAAFLYGSQVKGTASVWSDIDLAIISPDFSADLFEEKLKLMNLAAQIDDRIEPRPFRPQDFVASEPLVSEIQKTGIRIA